MFSNLNTIPAGKNVYFASDMHFGAPNRQESLKREAIFIRWLEHIRPDATAIFLLGDIFDFWFEYKHVVPKGYVRLLGKLAELSDLGIKIYIFTGNHDMWMFDYFPKELSIPIYHDPVSIKINDKQFFIGHGDGLGPGDRYYKFLKSLFRNKFCQWLFARLHPNFGIGLANYWSKKSRSNNFENNNTYLEEKEWLVLFSKSTETQTHHDYYVFGHRHFPLEVDINNNSRYFNLGEWIENFTYGVFDGAHFQLNEFNGSN